MGSYSRKLPITLVSAAKPYLRGRPGTVGLPVQTTLVQLLFISKILFTFFHKTSYLNEEVDCTEPSLSVSVPWFLPLTIGEHVLDTSTGKELS